MRTRKQITRKLERQLASYAVAAVAIGAAVPSAAAQVVYTQTDLKLTHGALTFDIDGNGSPELNLVNEATNSYYFVGGLLFVTGNDAEDSAVLGRKGKLVYDALPVPQGVSIGPTSPAAFLKASRFYAPFMAEAAYSYNQGRVLTGAFANITGKYLGFRFTESGATHYGWMRLTVTADPSRLPAIVVKVSGYAYESTPDTAIIAGDRGRGTPQSPHVQESGATLGELSLGAARRK